MTWLPQKVQAVITWCLTGALLLALAGCATAPKIDWPGRVGSYTFDQALEELGPPARSATASDGSMVGDWLTQSGRLIVTQQPTSYSSWGRGPILQTTTTVSTPAYYLRLNFDPAGHLKSWKKFAQ